MLLSGRVEELELRGPLPDGREVAVATARAHELMHGRVVVTPGGQARKVTNIHQRRRRVHAAGVADALKRKRRPRQLPYTRRAARTEARAGAHARIGLALERKGARHPDLAELLREPLDPAAREREVPIDPDERTGRDLLAFQQSAHNQVELAVLRADGVAQLIPPLRAGLPVDEHRGGPARVGVGLEPCRQQRRGRIRVGVEVDDEEIAHVMPRWRWDEARLAARRGRQRHAQHFKALPLGGDRRLVEAEVGARRQRPPGVGGEAVVRPAARLVIRLELFHVAVELDEAGLLDDPHVRGDVAADPMPHGPPREPATVTAEVVECIAQLADVDQLKGKVMEVGIALGDEGHHMMIAAGVQPHALIAEPIGEAHAERLGVEALLLDERAGQEVDVAEPAWVPKRRRARCAGVSGPRLAPSVGDQLEAVAIGVSQPHLLLPPLDGDAKPLELPPGIGRRAAGSKLPGDVVQAGLIALDQLERARLVVAAERGAVTVALAHVQPELPRPAPSRLVEVSDGERHVVETGQPDHARTTRTGSRLTPLKKFERSRSGGPASSNQIPRARISSKTIRTSSRARWAPKQWCIPPGPKVMCGFGSRATSKRSGSANTVSSRLPDTNQVVTLSSALISLPPSSVSTAAVRRK